ncbi:hypothetical protein N7492_002061 [Penicillium capsulatum]|uniref:PNPLA domain-containing protein n=1 Tax=Penicillium capsulatum TaxID=69766 RepID=A0A9W9IKQ1_9EURO|nr:hypothetical protein N7492_002061 [Penicillium capsulatum]KAJ6123321.1 hypothetical protein N7512_005786 [Penicillium capsulatum]
MAFRACYEASCSRHLNTRVLHHFEGLFESVEDGYMNGPQVHKRNIEDYAKFFTRIYSNTSVVNLKPNTAGVRVVGIDGGGARGVTPLGFMGELQKLLGNCQLHEMIDLATGTSSGGLTVLAKFHQQWPVAQCAAVFEKLARRCFSRSESAFGRLKSLVHYVTTDAMYDECFLEDALRDLLKDNHLFGYVPNTISGTKVALTTTSRGNSRFILTNYNGSTPLAKTGGYTIIRPREIHNEPLLWQAARATTAAPIFFKPVKIAGEEFCDGGLAFPSPIELATWEASRIWNEDTVNDVTISLGTGEVTKSLPIDSGRSHSLQRLWSSFMDFLDGHSRSRDMKNGLCQQQRKDFFRLDTQLPSPIRLDDTRSLELQKEMVFLTPQRQLTDVATALQSLSTSDIQMR